MPDLWTSDARADWQQALDRYPAVVAAQGVERLPMLDAWYRDELPTSIRGRAPMHVTHAELVRVTEWKMARGVWRAPNLVLVRGNDPEAVGDASREALGALSHATRPIAALAALAGVGPATASAVVSAAAPERFPFFDELVAAQVPGLGAVKWTLGYYARYADALRERAAALGGAWTPAAVERALWSAVGGKTGMVRAASR
jgi:hypothetical protein